MADPKNIELDLDFHKLRDEAAEAGVTSALKRVGLPAHEALAPLASRLGTPSAKLDTRSSQH